MRIALCVGAGLALLAGPALAQRTERPEVRVGDRWQFVRYYSVPSTKPNLAWEINSVTATEISGTENGEPLLMTPDLNVVDSPMNKQSNPKALSFPLEVGNRWRFASDWLFKPKGSKGSIVVDVEVVAHEKVEVPAGEFEAFKLVSKGRVSGTSPINSQYDAVITTTYWYAAAARATVKSVTHNPYLGVSTVEMVASQLRP
jgi:hypothetical protein